MLDRYRVDAEAIEQASMQVKFRRKDVLHVATAEGFAKALFK